MFDFSLKPQELSKGQRICKWVAACIALIYYFLYKVYMPYISHSLIDPIFMAGFVVHFRKEALKVGVFTMYCFFAVVFVRLIMFFQGLLNPDLLQTALSVFSQAEGVTSKNTILVNTLHFILSLALSIIFALIIFLRRFQAKVPSLFLLYLILLPIVIIINELVCSILIG